MVGAWLTSYLSTCYTLANCLLLNNCPIENQNHDLNFNTNYWIKC